MIAQEDNQRMSKMGSLLQPALAFFPETISEELAEELANDLDPSTDLVPRLEALALEILRHQTDLTTGLSALAAIDIALHAAYQTGRTKLLILFCENPFFADGLTVVQSNPSEGLNELSRRLAAALNGSADVDLVGHLVFAYNLGAFQGQTGQDQVAVRHVGTAH